MKGYVARKGNRWYAVIYEGTDPITGRSDAAGIPPAASTVTPSGSPPGSPASATAPTTKLGP
jgi:hypothetical protein